MPRSDPARTRTRRRAGSASLFAAWEALHEPAPATLYHYTTAQGLLAMLKSGHVWATESRYMNDPREFLHGAELMLTVIDKRLRRRKNRALLQLRESVAVHVEEKMQNVRIFCMSFCLSGDLLSQWRGYGDTGGGYALGFVPQLLIGREPAERPPLRVLRRVVYDPAEQEQLIDAWAAAAASEGDGRLIDDFWRFFSEAVICFKDHAYREEDEWRLVQFGRAWSGSKYWQHPVQFRERKGKLVPYADLDLSRARGPYAGKLPISEIVHGPTQDPERSGKALRMLIESCGYGEDQIALTQSKVPFTA